MDIAQITAVIGVAASLLCTLVVGALTYFIKKTLVSLEDADKKNADDIRAEAAKRERELKELSGQFNDLKNELPIVFTLREDFIRSMNNVDLNIGKVERNIGKVDQKVDQVLQIITSIGKEK